MEGIRVLSEVSKKGASEKTVAFVPWTVLSELKEI